MTLDHPNHKMTTPWELMLSKGWDCVDTGVVYHVGPRVEFGALQVKGTGYTLLDAMADAMSKEA